VHALAAERRRLSVVDDSKQYANAGGGHGMNPAIVGFAERASQRPFVGTPAGLLERGHD
jgi:hypothetical protein